MQKLNEFNINNASNDVQISIIIPTKNRLVTLKHTLKTVLNDNYQSLKVYISIQKKILACQIIGSLGFQKLKVDMFQF